MAALTGLSTRTGAAVRKPSVKEPAGSCVGAVLRALWRWQRAPRERFDVNGRCERPPTFALSQQAVATQAATVWIGQAGARSGMVRARRLDAGQ